MAVPLFQPRMLVAIEIVFVGLFESLVLARLAQAGDRVFLLAQLVAERFRWGF